MNQEAFNLSLRKFLKQFGIAAQRDVETAVRAMLESGKLSGSEKLRARAVLTIGNVPVETLVEGEITLA